MKIMVLTPSFERGSPHQGVFLFAKHLHERRHNVVFAALNFCGSAQTTLLGEIEKVGLPHHCFEMNGWPGMLHLARVSKYVSNNSIDVVLSYGLRPDVVNSCLSGPVRVSSVRGILREHYAEDFGWLVSRVATMLHLRALRSLDGIFTLSPEMCNHLIAEGLERSKLHFIKNFVNVAEIRSVLNGYEPAEDTCIHVGYFGLLIKRKRVDVALRAVAKLVVEFQRKNLMFHIVGEGPLRSNLTRLAKNLGLNDKVVFHGYLTNPFEVMKRMDLVVLTSAREGIPRCLMEALSLGKTCIASDIPGMAGLIRHGETGYLVREGDVEGLASLMSDIIGGDQYLSPEKLYQYMLKEYDARNCAEEMWSRVQKIATTVCQGMGELG